MQANQRPPGTSAYGSLAFPTGSSSSSSSSSEATARRVSLSSLARADVQHLGAAAFSSTQTPLPPSFKTTTSETSDAGPTAAGMLVRKQARTEEGQAHTGDPHSSFRSVAPRVAAGTSPHPLHKQHPAAATGTPPTHIPSDDLATDPLYAELSKLWSSPIKHSKADDYLAAMRERSAQLQALFKRLPAHVSLRWWQKSLNPAGVPPYGAGKDNHERYIALRSAAMSAIVGAGKLVQ